MMFGIEIFWTWHDGMSDCVSRVRPHEPAYCKALMCPLALQGWYWPRGMLDTASPVFALPAGEKRRFAVDVLMRALTLKTVFKQVNPMILLAMDHEWFLDRIPESRFHRQMRTWAIDSTTMNASKFAFSLKSSACVTQRRFYEMS